MQLLIYGARSLALGVAVAIKALYPKYSIKGFLVTSLRDNPTALMELPVWELQDAAARFQVQNKEKYRILIAVPDDLQPEISNVLESFDCHNFICLTSELRGSLMERYYEQSDKFLSLKRLDKGPQKGDLSVFMAQFHRDRSLRNRYDRPEWIHPLQVGKALTDIKIAESTDDEGETISEKNPNYCELTALYWIWKNRLAYAGRDKAKYDGLFHYRRVLKVEENDLYRLGTGAADVILPFPTIHEPDSLEHHTRYISENDWDAMKKALAELRPEYAEALPEVFGQRYFYNYNILIAKSWVLKDYCAWLFPILARTEELSVPRGSCRSDRYIGYLGENLLTLYFMVHKKDLNVVHTQCVMLT